MLLKGSVIEDKLPDEGAIRLSSVTLQQRYCLFQHLEERPTDDPPSMLYDVRHQLPTEVYFLSGAIAREAQRAGVAAPLHTAVYRLIKAKEASWTFKDENRAAAHREKA